MKNESLIDLDKLLENNNLQKENCNINKFKLHMNQTIKHTGMVFVENGELLI